MILAKSKGRLAISLEAHTSHVVDEARALLDARPFTEEKYRRLTGEDLRARLLRAAEWHDVGKRHRTWQMACRADREEWLATGRSGTHLMKANLRHEFASLWQAAREGAGLSLPERAAIAAHHGKLSFKPKHERRWTEDDGGRFKELWDGFTAQTYRWTGSEPSLAEKALRERYRIAGVRALLQLADQRASRAEASGALPPIEPFEYDFPYDRPRGVQHLVTQHWDVPELILRAPTGSGKTDAAMLWAKRQIDAGRADRLVIAMPTRFTSNALEVGVGENAADTGLYHSSAWYAKYRDEDADDEARDLARERHRLARLLMTPVTVCTIDHLCIALTGTREDHHSIFFALTNACVVIDEADFYDPFVQANVQVLLRVLRLFDVPVLVMSATVPESAKELYGISCLKDTGKQDAEEQEGSAVEKREPRCIIHRAGDAETPADVEALMDQVAEADAAIVYANTVARALAYYDCLRAKGVQPILYHSRFTEPDKKRIEEDLVAALGRKAWDPEEEDTEPEGVAVLTQIGEMSLNISAPLMVSDLCPFDRLAQRAGRLSRFEGMAPGDLHVVRPVKNDALYPAPYGEYERKKNDDGEMEGQWLPGRAIEETDDKLESKTYTAQDFVNAVNNLYPAVEPPGAKAEQNQRHFREHLEHNWLIVPAGQTEEDADETERWRSRDIPAQRTVLTQCPDHFDSYAEYRAFELECGISCPVWQVEKAKDRLHRAREVTFPVGEDEVTQPYSSCYSPKEGLILDQDRERSSTDCII